MGTDWHPEDVKAAVRKTGITLSALAENAGFEGSAARQALKRPWPKAEAVIARRLKLHPKDIWPSRYSPDGTPRRVRASAGERKPEFPKNHRQKERVG